ncbi:tRNA glutamyl-Q(34) synthetase GluQRS [Marinicella gelatinilytica]|uniref:tRNA glutamyl-Q(34) synthetase GluQRS n=1 Tax=Marinicella gelatinilytica TaxID=2996017 RepID=UPI002260BE89|nr:tRNA glutamyl-Q(34) synthetase GluQRS [Marinicella gelatinilytica]MCX7544273.1 tRNA glutamyl-Q(34) synthetase GluQRS [Marinicella gelatinilytica]
MNNKAAVYTGRFAPSPSGDLHFGSLLAALVSYCEARSNQGLWRLRIEDVDSTRTVIGADERIFKTLQAFALHWDGDVIYQTSEQQQEHYQQALQKLQELNLTYQCRCTRKQLAGHDTYPGHCRLLPGNHSAPHSIRVIVDDTDICFDDGFQGPQKQNPAKQCGDFNIKRKDGLFSYQLAVVVDDANSGITHVVRGIDILESTARQIFLQQKLGLPTPQYAHFPIITNQHGRKLSKQNHATAVNREDPVTVTRLALQLLNQSLPDKKPMTQQQLIQWAVDHWQPDRFKGMKQIVYGATP